MVLSMGVPPLCGLLSHQATTGCLTEQEEVQLQAAIEEDCRGTDLLALPPPPALAAAPGLCLPEPRPALLHQPLGLSHAQQALLSPQPQADGTTIYPGETTLVQHEPLLDMQDPFPVLLTQALQAGGYQSPAAVLPETLHAQFHDAVTGEALGKINRASHGQEMALPSRPE